MDIQQLRYVVEVERTGSITKAAQNLFLSQPNLSKSIRELENEIGITIFSRTSKGAATTQRGQEFLVYAKTIISQIDELESIYKPENSDTVRLNISVPRASYISVAFTNFLNRIQVKQEFSIGFKEVDSLKSINDVTKGSSDIAIIRYQELYEEYFLSVLETNGLYYEPIFEFHPLILCSKTHPLAKFNPIPIHMLYSYPEIIHGDIQIPSVPVNRINYSTEKDMPGKRIYVKERGSQLDMLRLAEGTYMWVSYIPKSILDSNRLVMRNTTPDSIMCKDVLVYHKLHHLSQYESLFIDLVKEEYKESKKNYFADTANHKAT